MHSNITPPGKVSNNKRNVRCLYLRATYRLIAFENQDDPIGNQDPRKKTEHQITGKDLPGRQIRTTQPDPQDHSKLQDRSDLQDLPDKIFGVIARSDRYLTVIRSLESSQDRIVIEWL